MLVVITLPHIFEGEADVLNALFAEGLQCLHLRKTDASEAEVESLLRLVKPEYYSHITVHYHHGLAVRHSLGGVHLSGRTPGVPEGWQGRVSRSCHSLAELADEPQRYDYSFLSPIFDSISKQGYNAAFSPEVLLQAHRDDVLNDRAIALGGVEPQNMKQLHSWGFGGAAVLGGLWSSTRIDDVLDRYALYASAARVWNR